MNISRLNFIRGLFGMAAVAAVPKVVEAVVRQREYVILNGCAQDIFFKFADGEVIGVPKSPTKGITSSIEIAEEKLVRLRKLREYRMLVRAGFVGEFTMDGGVLVPTEWMQQEYEDSKKYPCDETICDETIKEIEGMVE